jgi:hypothetical protein
MTVASSQYPLVGSATCGNSSSFIEVADNDTLYTPSIPVGTIVDFNDPYYGAIKAIRLCVPKNTTAIKVGTQAVYSAAANAGITSNYSYVINPVTANQCRPLAISINAVPLNASFAQYAWFALAGTLPVWALAATAINTPVYISATAGAAFVTLTAGRQLVGVNPVVAATGTVTKTATIVSGNPIVQVASSDGLFVGQSTTGATAAASLITAISADGRSVTLAANANATGVVSLVATNNDATNFFPICQFNFPFNQGNVT